MSITRVLSILIVLMLIFPSCWSQNYPKDNESRDEASFEYYQMVMNYLSRKLDLVPLNSIIEVNGIVHPKDTYGYIKYMNALGIETKCLFQHLGGVMIVSKKDFDEVLRLPDSTQDEIAICLQSPINKEWGGAWDLVLVKGSFNVSQLFTTRDMLSPCFRFIIISIGKKHFKIEFQSWGVQTSYYSVEPYRLTIPQMRKLDRKEQRIYKRAHLKHYERELW